MTLIDSKETIIVFTFIHIIFLFCSQHLSFVFGPEMHPCWNLLKSIGIATRTSKTQTAKWMWI